MAQVSIEVGGRSYPIACRDGEEDRLHLLGRLVDARAADVIRATGKGNETRELLMTALLLADALDDAQSKIAALEAQDAERAQAVARCAERIDAIAATLENGALENERPSA